jgi:ferric iron reductase protein FhuF
VGAVQTKDREKKQKCKRLNRAVKSMVKFEKRTQEKFALDLQEDYKEHELLYALMRNKTKPKSELCSVQDRNGKLVWTQDPYLRTWMEDFMELLNVQSNNITSTLLRIVTHKTR